MLLAEYNALGHQGFFALSIGCIELPSREGCRQGSIRKPDQSRSGNGPISEGLVDDKFPCLHVKAVSDSSQCKIIRIHAKGLTTVL